MIYSKTDNESTATHISEIITDYTYIIDESEDINEFLIVKPNSR